MSVRGWTLCLQQLGHALEVGVPPGRAVSSPGVGQETVFRRRGVCV